MEKLAKQLDGKIRADSFADVEETIEDAKGKGYAYLNLVKEKGEQLWSGAQSISRASWNQAKTFIRSNPGRTLAYAVLFGVVAGALLKFRRKK